MSKILAVIKREYLQIVRTKGFVIGTILGPVFMSLILVVPILMSVISVAQQETIGVIDAGDQVFSELQEKLNGYTLKDGSARYVLQKFSSGDVVEAARESLNQKVLNKELSAYLYIPEDVLNGGESEFISEHVSDFEKTQNLRASLNSVVVEKRLKVRGHSFRFLF